MKIDIGDLLEIKGRKIGIVVRKFKSGSIAVLEHIAPMVTTTHDSFKTLEMVEMNKCNLMKQ